MHFLFFCFHRPPLSTAVHRPPPTAHRPLPTATHRCPPLSAAVSVSVPVSVSAAVAVSVAAAVSARPRPRRFLHSPSLSAPSSPSPLPLPLIFPSLRPSVPPSPVYPCLSLFIPVYPCLSLFIPCLFLSVLVCSCLFLSVLVCSCLFLSLVPPSFCAPAFLALSFRPVLLVSGTTCSRAFLHFVLFCYPLRASFLNLFFGHPFPCPPLRVPPLRILFLLCPSRILINAFNGSVCKEITLFLSGLKIIFIFVVSSD